MSKWRPTTLTAEQYLALVAFSEANNEVTDVMLVDYRSADELVCSPMEIKQKYFADWTRTLRTFVDVASDCYFRLFDEPWAEVLSDFCHTADTDKCLDEDIKQFWQYTYDFGDNMHWKLYRCILAMHAGELTVTGIESLPSSVAIMCRPIGGVMEEAMQIMEKYPDSPFTKIFDGFLNGKMEAMQPDLQFCEMTSKADEVVEKQLKAVNQFSALIDMLFDVHLVDDETSPKTSGGVKPMSLDDK